MKNSLAAVFLLFSSPIFAQLTVTEQFQKIVTDSAGTAIY